MPVWKRISYWLQRSTRSKSGIRKNTRSSLNRSHLVLSVNWRKRLWLNHPERNFMANQPDDKAFDQSGNAYHIPVLLKEAIEGMNLHPSGTYVDCTFGGGGHSRVILERLDQNGRLFVFDQDADAKSNMPDDPRMTFVPH